MSEIDAKVNMSLDEIIKMENKKKRQKGKVTGFKGGRGAAKANLRGQGGQTRRAIPKMNAQARKQQGKVRAGFVKKNSGMFRAKSNTNLNRAIPRNNNVKGNFTGRRFQGRVGLTRSKSRSNLARFGSQSNLSGKRTNSMPNLRDPNSVHSRLGYQTPAQIAYRNKIKRAKQLLIQNQKLNIQNTLRTRINQAIKPLTTLQRSLELRQQALLPQPTSGLRSDLILRAQRRAQYEEKLMRIKY